MQIDFTETEEYKDLFKKYDEVKLNSADSKRARMAIAKDLNALMRKFKEGLRNDR